MVSVSIVSLCLVCPWLSSFPSERSEAETSATEMEDFIDQIFLELDPDMEHEIEVHGDSELHVTGDADVEVQGGDVEVVGHDDTEFELEGGPEFELEGPEFEFKGGPGHDNGFWRRNGTVYTPSMFETCSNAENIGAGSKLTLLEG